MATTSFYGIIAVKFSAKPKHPHYVSHVLVIELTADGKFYPPAKLYSKDQALTLKPLHTMIWNYTDAIWSKGAAVDVEQKGGIKYLRSRKNDTEKDNLLHLLELEDFI